VRIRLIFCRAVLQQAQFEAIAGLTQEETGKIDSSQSAGKMQPGNALLSRLQN
jgi:hypothetical protein